MSGYHYFSVPVLLASVFVSPAMAINLTTAASDGITHTQTHTDTPIPEPASFLEDQRSYKLASVCFLGFGECGDDQGFNAGGDFSLDTVAQCKNEGFEITSCEPPAYPSGQCPYNSNYYAACKNDPEQACKNAGYVTSCEEGYVQDGSQVCSYDSSYFKCKCNPCDGYSYTQAQAEAQGYVSDGSCQSCGTVKYRRKEAPCDGYNICECGGEIGSSTCYTGTVKKYSVCKSCCENKCTETSCPDGYICELESCSNKYCITGCAVNYTDWCSQPVTDCGALGYTKTASQCPDGYLKCPYGETVFCPTVTTCNIGDIYYTDKTCSSAADYNSAKTVLGVVVYVTDGGKHGQIMAPWPIDENGNKSSSNSTTMIWGGYGTDISSLLNYGSQSSALQDYDSCGNTDKIVTPGNAGTYPAAWATRKYAPTTETAGKWCLPAAGVLYNVYKHRAIIRHVTSVVGVEYPDCCNWSSSESSINSAWLSNFNFSYGLDTSVGKNSDAYVRPVLEF